MNREPPPRYYIEMVEADAKKYADHCRCCTPLSDELKLPNGNYVLEFRHYVRYTSIPKSIRDCAVDGHGFEHKEALKAKQWNDQPWYNPAHWEEDPGPKPIPSEEEVTELKP